MFIFKQILAFVIKFGCFLIEFDTVNCVTFTFTVSVYCDIRLTGYASFWWSLYI